MKDVGFGLIIIVITSLLVIKIAALQKELKSQAVQHDLDITEIRRNQSSLAAGILELRNSAEGYAEEVETESVEK